MVSFDVQGPINVAILELFPSDNVVQKFCSIFLLNLDEENIVTSRYRVYSYPELCRSFEEIAKDDSLGCILIVTHGIPAHKATIEDPELRSNEDFKILGDFGVWSKIFRKAFDQRIVVFAICHSSDKEQIDLIYHQAMAAHVITPHPDNPELHIQPGGEAVAKFINNIYHCNLTQIPPESVENAFDEMNNEFPKILKLWPYEVDPELMDHFTQDL